MQKSRRRDPNSKALPSYLDEIRFGVPCISREAIAIPREHFGQQYEIPCLTVFINTFNIRFVLTMRHLIVEINLLRNQNSFVEGRWVLGGGTTVHGADRGLRLKTSLRYTA